MNDMKIISSFDSVFSFYCIIFYLTLQIIVGQLTSHDILIKFNLQVLPQLRKFLGTEAEPLL